MIDRGDITESNLALVVFRALKTYDDGQLLAWLVDPDPILRELVIMELHLRPNSKVWGRTKELAGHSRHDYRICAAKLMGQLGTPQCPFFSESHTILAEMLPDPYFEVRSAAIAAIGHLARLGKAPSAHLAGLVVQAANDEAPLVREAVAYALLSIQTSGTDGALQALSDDENQDVREAASFSVEARREITEEMAPATS